jgi:hypothetical protein
MHLSSIEESIMHYHTSIVVACCLAGFMTTVSADNTEYLLIPLEQDMPDHGEAVIVEPPHAATFNTGDCGKSFTVVGDGTDFSESTAEHYGGTAYSGRLKVEDSDEVTGFVMAHSMKVGTHLSDFQLLDGGQICSERVNGETYTFRKYSAVLH